METNSEKGGFFKGMLTALLLVALVLGGLYCWSEYSETWLRYFAEESVSTNGGAATALEEICHE